ncbi:MAG: aminotransferase class V-fold PLP-dependent enzyme [Clostridiales bacterium]|nr:aminotransferase class V-fold PLP-dependent enzyme [Clostridiales bacterium]
MINNCFASDNCSGVHFKIMQALHDVNIGHEISYGNDQYTQEALDLFKELFGAFSRIYFVYNGTGANSLALGSVLRPYSAVITPSTAHVNEDETGAPERYSGCKVIAIDTDDGKLRPEHIKPFIHSQGVMHHSQIKVASITNPTEVGTLYSPQEIRVLSEYLHEHDILLHMDGARLANAAIALDLGFCEITKDCGVDILSFGATKNGLMFGEAVVFLNENLGEDFMYIRKNGTQLHSKMRYISCQFATYLKDDLWKKNATHANTMARRLYDGFSSLEGITLLHETECNSVFAVISNNIMERIQKEYLFYNIHRSDEQIVSRFMCSFDTKEEEIDRLVELARS